MKRILLTIVSISAMLIARSAHGDVARMCRVAQRPPIIKCERGGAFLCVNTPQGGVAEDNVIIRGIIDLESSPPSAVRISVQHDYTKKTAFVDTSNPEKENCAGTVLNSASFCIDKEGFFAARVPLENLGPHTIAVSATRFSGGAETKTVMTSRVGVLKMEEGQISYDPDIKGIVDSDYVNVTVSLLGACQYCDFIGASTFGVTVTVDNLVRDSLGNTSRISCSTQVEQGGQGKFTVGVPVSEGTNELTISACNAAGEKIGCPKIAKAGFQSGMKTAGVQIISPLPMPSYSSSQFPSIPFEFELKGLSNTCVNVVLNTNAPVEVCPEQNGRYFLDLHPSQGVNIVTVEGENINFPWVFGWGKIVSPFSQNGTVADDLLVKEALEFAIPASTVTDILAPIATNVIRSDEFGEFIKNIQTDKTTPSEPNRIPACEEDNGSLTTGDFGLDGIGDAKIENVSFEKNLIRASINLDNVRFHFKLVNGENNDDGKTIPLKISLRKAKADLSISVDDKTGVILLGSPHTDCDFKKERYCKGTPAALIPQNIIGDATPFGGFVRCSSDVEDEETSQFCKALNSVNAQTGLLNGKVLDSINHALYCSGSEMLTRLAGRQDWDLTKILGSATLGLRNMRVGTNFRNIHITGDGITIGTDVFAGDKALFSQMPKELQIPQVGFIANGKKPVTIPDVLDAQFRAAINSDFMNLLLFVISQLDDANGFFDISEPFFNKHGFDFVSHCDAFTKVMHKGDVPSPLCNMRPRVTELLGTPLVKYGYFSANQPLLVNLRASRALSPHLSAVKNNGEESVLELGLGGFVISFYALEVDNNLPPDEYGNLPVKLDGRGNPIIHSMRPEDPDPRHGQIASFELALQLPLALSDVHTNPQNPSEFVLLVWPIADRSRLLITWVPGSNSTLVPPGSIISALREKLQYAINIYASKENAVKIPLPKSILFDEDKGDLMKLLGLEKIVFGAQGMSLSINDEALMVDLNVLFTQTLHRGGEEIKQTLP